MIQRKSLHMKLAHEDHGQQVLSWVRKNGVRVTFAFDDTGLTISETTDRTLQAVVFSRSEWIEVWRTLSDAVIRRGVRGLFHSSDKPAP